MAYTTPTQKDGDMFAHKTTDLAVRRDAAQTKPKKLSREQLAHLYKSVTRRIPKTLAILAK
jgi:hypothetical protein